MTKHDVLQKIQNHKLVPVIRTADGSEARKAFDVLAGAGISVFEITMTVPGAVEMIAEMAAANPEILIGAGTVLKVDQAKACADAGAAFIVSPIFEPAVVQYCRGNELVVIPAGITPTEVYTAWNAGADIVKVFPCGAMGGARYLKVLKSVFPETRLMPTGGVTLETARDFLNAGAFAVGAGTDLINFDHLRSDNIDAITKRIADYQKAIS